MVLKLKSDKTDWGGSMTEAGMPETIVEIKKWLQKHIAKNARVIDRNDQVLRFNNGETKWFPRKKGLCNWLKGIY
jgi:hypothetical protein